MIKKIALVYDDTYKWTTAGYLKDALNTLGFDADHFLPDEADSIPTGYDLYLNIDENERYLFPEHLRPSAYWVIDTHMDYGWRLNKARVFDFVFAADKSGAERLKRDNIRNVYWLPLACDPKMHKRYDIPREHDVAFVGNWHHLKERERYLNFLKKKFKDKKLFIDHAYGDELVKIYSSSKIVFNKSAKNDINMRMFEAMSCGSLLITNRIYKNGQEELFGEAPPFVTYRSKGDLVKKIRHYLSGDSAREEIASRGSEEVLKSHTYAHRVKEIVKIVESKQGVRPTHLTFFQKNVKCVGLTPSAPSVVILTRNQKGYLEKSLDSLLRQTVKPGEIIVVDNASTDGTTEFLRSLHPEIDVIENASNLGFSKAVNKGLKRAAGFYTVVLTADTALAPDCLEAFLSYADNNADIGLLSGNMYDYSDKKLIFSGKKIKLGWSFKQYEPEGGSGARESDLIPGTFLFSKTSLLNGLGRFDERYFFYFEDLDITLRFKKNGFKNLLIPGAKAFHLEKGRGIEKYKNDEKIQFELVKNAMITYMKHAKPFWLMLFFVRSVVLGFVKGLFCAKNRNAALKARWWILCHAGELIKSRRHILKRKKICFVQPHDEFGSIERYILTIINSLCGDPFYDITFLCPKGKQADLLLETAKARVKVIRFNQKKRGILRLISLMYHLRKIRPSLVHVNDPDPAVMLAANLSGIKNKVITYHTPTLRLNYNRRGRLAEKLAFAGNWNIIATTESLRDVLAEKRNFARDKISVIHYGLDTNRLKRNITRDKMREALEVKEGAFVITNVGRLCPQKRQDVLIRSLPLLPKEISENVVLLLAGSGESEKPLSDLISNLQLGEKTRLLGHREDIPDILNCTDVFALSSAFEGACFAVMEAMALGIPVIATDIAGVKDTTFGGKAAMLVPTDSPAHMARAIETLYRDKGARDAMAGRARKRFEENFAEDKMIKNTKSLYENITQ